MTCSNGQAIKTGLQLPVTAATRAFECFSAGFTAWALLTRTQRLLSPGSYVLQVYPGRPHARCSIKDSTEPAIGWSSCSTSPRAADSEQARSRGSTQAMCLKTWMACHLSSTGRAVAPEWCRCRPGWESACERRATSAEGGRFPRSTAGTCLVRASASSGLTRFQVAGHCTPSATDSRPSLIGQTGIFSLCNAYSGTHQSIPLSATPNPRVTPYGARFTQQTSISSRTIGTPGERKRSCDC